MKKHIVILMPLYKFMYTQAVISFTGMLQGISNRGDTWEIAYINTYNLVASRNALVKYAMEKANKKADYVLMLDYDHIYDSKALYTLIEKMDENKLDMLSGSYYVRTSREFAMLKRDKKGVLHKIVPDKNTKGIVECDVVGLGFCIFKMEMLKDLYNKYNGILFEYTNTNYGGEDLHFCNIIKKEGYKVCFDADTIIGHLTVSVNK